MLERPQTAFSRKIFRILESLLTVLKVFIAFYKFYTIKSEAKSLIERVAVIVSAKAAAVYFFKRKVISLVKLIISFFLTYFSIETTALAGSLILLFSIETYESFDVLSFFLYVFYPCDKQGYYNRVLDFFLL